jgi:hypothetical protein
MGHLRARMGICRTMLASFEAAEQRGLSRVAEGTGPAKPQQLGSNAPVLLPAK